MTNVINKYIPPATINTSTGLNVVEIIYFATPVRSINVTVLAKEVPLSINIISLPYAGKDCLIAIGCLLYTSEILRSAFQTIKPGFIEAGKSLGLPRKVIFYKIQIPIAIKQSLPAYGNEIILMLKGTSLASTVTLMDLTGVAKYIISTTFKPVEVFIVAGGIYLFMTFVIHNLIKYLEKKFSYQ